MKFGKKMAPLKINLLIAEPVEKFPVTQQIID